MISIYTSLYKSDQYIDGYIKKITKVSAELEESSIPHEFILIFNETTEKEKKVIEYLDKSGGKLSTHLKILIVPREPLYASWNRGVSNALYNIVTAWNVDDSRTSKGLIEGLMILSKNSGILYSPYMYKRYVRILGVPVLAKIKKITPPAFDKNKFMSEMHIGPFFMYDKKTFDAVGRFDDTMKIAGDFDWQSRAAEKNILFIRGTETLGTFSNDGRSLSGSKNSLLKDEVELVLKRRNESSINTSAN